MERIFQEPAEITGKLIEEIIYWEWAWCTTENERKHTEFVEITPKRWKTKKKLMTHYFDYATLPDKQNVTEKWTKSCILIFSKKGVLGILKNYRDISLTAMTCFSIVSDVKLRKSLGKSEWISKKSTHYFSDSNYSSNHWRSPCKKSRSNTFANRFLQSIWFHK